jgi:hypothetical protein
MNPLPTRKSRPPHGPEGCGGMRIPPRAAGLVLLLLLLSHAWPRVHSKGGKKAGDNNRCAVLGKAAAAAGGYGLGQTTGARHTYSQHSMRMLRCSPTRLQHLRESRRR